MENKPVSATLKEQVKAVRFAIRNLEQELASMFRSGKFNEEELAEQSDMVFALGESLKTLQNIEKLQSALSTILESTKEK